MSLLNVLEEMKQDKKLKLDADTLVTGREDVDIMSTGSIIIDKLLGKRDPVTKKSYIGGIGRGRITEVFGLESSGKTTLALHIAKEFQDRGGNVAFVDFEAALDQEYAENAVGVDLDPNRFAYIRPPHLEQGCDVVDHLLDQFQKTRIDCVIVDSVKAMTPKKILEGMMLDEPPMALQARLIGKWLSRLVKKIKETKTSVILLNQMTKNIKSTPWQSGGEFETPGGLSVRFYATTRLEIKLVKKQTIKGINDITNKEEEVPDSNLVRASVIKNKIGIPYRRAEFYIKYGEGIDNDRSIIDMAISHNIIKRGGAWYSYKEEEGGFRIQGEDKVRDMLGLDENRGLLSEIAEALIFKQDDELKAASKKFEEEEEKVQRKIAKKAKGKKKEQKKE